MKTSNPFCLTSRSVSLYDNLRNDLELRSVEGILDSLPRFFRMALIESQEAWAEAINLYDLVTFVSVSNDFSQLVEITRNVFVSKEILPTGIDVNFIDEKDFRTSRLIVIEGKILVFKTLFWRLVITELFI